ncbi:NUDIX domain-containing protein [Alloiococcus sp. CFN-8]|uniref:NUDIX domain-containing protein n=1 Tax=Alloiococcus sp. CFN-8 TaxID=3416081 RepID=UPI003CF9FD8D
MGRVVRCQAVVLKDDKILVLRQYNYKRQKEYWLLPGGGLEENETTEQCILRELREETGLKVEIKEILFDEPGNGFDPYQRYVTFLCTPLKDSVGAAGNETVSYRKILELKWISATDEKQWNKYILTEQFYPSMKKIKDRLEVKALVGGIKV